MVGRASVSLLLLATISAGCTQGTSIGSSSPPPSTIAAGSLPEGWTRCANEPEGWSIGYPGSWFTTDVYTDSLTGREVPRPKSACRRFDPEPFTIPLDGDPSYTALEAGIARSPIVQQVGSLTDPSFSRTLLRERWTVLGQPAVRLEVEALGAEGLVLKGTLRYGWIVDLGGNRSFSVLATADPDVSHDRYAAYREVADRAIATVVFPTGTS